MARNGKKPGKTTRDRRDRRDEAKPGSRRLNRRTWRQAALFLSFSALMVIICLVGLSPAGPQVSEGQMTRQRVVAEFPFSYTSELATQSAREAARRSLPPVYRLEQEQGERFGEYLRGLAEQIHAYLDTSELTGDIPSDGPLPELMRVTPEEMEEVLFAYDPDNTYNINAEDLTLLANRLNPQERRQVIEEGLTILSDIYHEGVYDPTQSQLQGSDNTVSFYHLQRESGRIARVAVQSDEEALRYLRINLAALNVPRPVSIALYQIIRKGLKPNLIFDEARTQALVQEAEQSVQPVVVNVVTGESIIEPNTRVTNLQVERLNAYRRELATADPRDFGIDALLIERAILAGLFLLASGVLLKVLGGRLAQEFSWQVMVCVVTVANMGIIRLILEFAEGVQMNGQGKLLELVPWLSPVALGAMLITFLLGPSTAVLVAIWVACFNSLMQGNSLGILFASLLTSMVAIYLSRDIQVRTRVVRSGFQSGLIMALSALLLGLMSSLEVTPIIEHMGAAILTGAFTGIAVVGILPLLEYFSKQSTNITLLELTDFNHPLLRRMQVECPGSYHHSLMVANLAENAAAAISANPLLCRVSAYFHDIGKLVKPEYFSENQRQGVNPHIERNPSISALIIKAHVKEGVALARKHKLPRVVTDVIREHHGTSLIQYFYYKAQQQRKSATHSPFGEVEITVDPADESTYRYEGPKPHFKESAIVLLADSVEAASRSLKKVTPQSVEELIEKIFKDRIDDGQLDNAPLTVREIAQIRKQFNFTCLNMLHSRVEYPKEAAPPKEEAKEPTPAEPKEAPAAKPVEAKRAHA